MLWSVKAVMLGDGSDHGRQIVKPPSRRERIAAQLADLKMPGALEARVPRAG